MTIAMGQQITAVFCILAGLVVILVMGNSLLEKNHKPEVSEEEPVENYDDLPPGYAVMLAWSEADITDKRKHRKQQEIVRSTMPTLAQALDRMVDN